jgi:hypothetical protein
MTMSPIRLDGFVRFRLFVQRMAVLLRIGVPKIGSTRRGFSPSVILPGSFLQVSSHLIFPRSQLRWMHCRSLGSVMTAARLAQAASTPWRIVGGSGHWQFESRV